MKKYNKKRDFYKTSEPKGKKKKSRKDNLFVIQKHDASKLHYDFRIEIEGVLKSWAIPKKPQKKKGAKNLAILTEDHPMDYANFEGEIPEGEYGAGTVKIWDKGTYKNLRTKKFGESRDAKMKTCYQQGKIEIWLDGDKLKGAYALVRTKYNKGTSKGKKWLFIKTDDKKVQED